MITIVETIGKSPVPLLLTHISVLISQFSLSKTLIHILYPILYFLLTHCLNVFGINFWLIFQFKGETFTLKCGAHQSVTLRTAITSVVKHLHETLPFLSTLHRRRKNTDPFVFQPTSHLSFPNLNSIKTLLFFHFKHLITNHSSKDYNHQQLHKHTQMLTKESHKNTRSIQKTPIDI